MVHRRFCTPALSVLFLVILCLCGCGKQRPAVLGRWIEIDRPDLIWFITIKKIDSPDILEFFDDGRVSFEKSTFGLTGTWVILEDGRLKVEVGVLGSTTTMTGGLEGPKLLLIARGDTTRYERSSPQLEASWPYLHAMKVGLSSAVLAEHAYFDDHRTYTTALTASQLILPSGVSIEITSADSTGWSATARHSSTTMRCTMTEGGMMKTGGGITAGIPQCN